MNKRYDLEDRTFQFAKNCRILIKSLKSTLSNIEDGKQLIRSSGSIGANYIEANEKLGQKDLVFRLKIARKEAKESLFWLKLLKEFNEEFSETDELIKESIELRKILSSIINKVQT